MRKKVYYLQDEITNNLYTSGSEWMLENNSQYVGTYHSYITGEVYTEPTWNPLKSKKLIKFKNTDQNNFEYTTLKPELKTKFDSIKNITPSIPFDAIKKGFITRYILQNVSSRVIYEVDKEQFESYSTKKIDDNLYIGVEIKWFVSGIRYSNVNEDLTGITTKTVSQNNAEQITIASKKLPDIRNYLTNLEEYYFDTIYSAPPDINGLE